MATRAPEPILKEVLQNYAKDFPPIYLDVVRHVDLSTLTWAPLVLRPPWNLILGNVSKCTVTVAGDAMHPMTPDLAQGGCQALEDAVILCRHIGKTFIEKGRQLVPSEVAKALEGYVNERKWRVAGLITGSYIAGWVQQDSSSWWRRFIRDAIFYKFVLPKLQKVSKYDCGKLPEVSENEAPK